MQLIVADDDAVTRAILSSALARLGVTPTVAHDGIAAWRLLLEIQAPVVGIVDWMMPGIDGIELCRRVRATPALCASYLIILTARDSRVDLISGLEAGADDYIIKPFDAAELRARLQVALRVASLQRQLTETVRELHSTNDHLTRLVDTDELTGLCSRHRWFEIATNELSRTSRYARPLSVLSTDLDCFKRINDTYGHAAGDQVLQQFGSVLKNACRQSDVAGRLGGDEFALLMPDTTGTAAAAVADRIIRSAGSIKFSGQGGFSCSVGITESRAGDDSLQALLGRADNALYEAKRAGRNQWAHHA